MRAKRARDPIVSKQPHLRAVALLLAAGCLVLPGALRAEYAFPIRDPYLATVLGTPEGERAPIPEGSVSETRWLPPVDGREVPPVFWQHTRFRYSVARQPGPAPLIFLIAGTGSLYDSGKLRYLQAVFHQAGFHVVNLSSPTHSEFVVTASRSSVPGRMPDDVADLYDAMERIWDVLRDELVATEFHLAGFSLGGSQAAFLAELDSRQQRFRFERVLLLNPSVDLFTSVRILDGLVREAVPGGAPELIRVFNDLFARVTRYFHQHGRESVDAELLFRIAEAESVTRQELQALIALTFRIASANMLFASDVMTGGHHLIEADADLGISTPLLPYMKVATRWTWEDYLDEILLPYWQESDPDLTRDALIEAGRMQAIGQFLGRAEHVGVMHNRDDLILGPGDIAWLERTFGDRAILYPTGGHGGNLMYRRNVEDMLAFFGVEPVKPLKSGGAE